MSKELPESLEETQDEIIKRQTELKRLHGHKRVLEATAERRQREETRKAAEADGKEVIEGTTTAPAPTPNPSGFPTAKSGVDFGANGQFVRMDPAPAIPPEPPPPPPPDPKVTAFSEGASAPFRGHRGPQIVDFRRRG